MELLSRAEEKAGRFWPWSKRRVQWILAFGGEPCVIEITHSWNTSISRLFVNRQLIDSGIGSEYRFEFAPYPACKAVAIVSNCKPALEIDGWPVEWLSPRVRREQSVRFSVFAARPGYSELLDRTHGTSTASSSHQQPLINH